MATITISSDLTVELQNGSKIKIPFSSTKKMECNGTLEFEVPADGDTKVELQPSTAAKVKFLLIKPKLSPAKDLTYTVSDGTTVRDSTDTKDIDKETEPFALKEAHLYSEGMITFVTNAEAKDRAEIDPKILKFTNESDEPIAIEILVGRDPIITP